MNAAIEALTVGRVGVDLYPQQSGVPLGEVTSFARFLGGTATNAMSSTTLAASETIVSGVVHECVSALENP